jgi:hypothetical protein
MLQLLDPDMLGSSQELMILSDCIKIIIYNIQCLKLN